MNEDFLLQQALNLQNQYSRNVNDSQTQERQVLPTAVAMPAGKDDLGTMKEHPSPSEGWKGNRSRWKEKRSGWQSGWKESEEVQQPKAILVKRRRIGTTGWIQIVTSNGLSYYAYLPTLQTTWLCPDVVKEWIEKRTQEKKLDKAKKERIKVASEKLSEEKQIAAWAQSYNLLIKTLRIPPIMTFDRAEPRLALETDFLKVPQELRPRVYEAARKLFFTNNADTSLQTQFITRLEQLTNKIRHDHTVQDVLDTFFTDSKWLGLKHDDSQFVEEKIQAKIKSAQDQFQLQLDKEAPSFIKLVVPHFTRFIMKEWELDNETEAATKAMDNQFVLDFLEPRILTRFRDHLQTAIGTATRAEDQILYSKFNAHADYAFIEALLADAWQHWCQHHWHT